MEEITPPPPPDLFSPCFFPEICHCGKVWIWVQQMILKHWYLQGFHAVKGLKTPSFIPLLLSGIHIKLIAGICPSTVTLTFPCFHPKNGDINMFPALSAAPTNKTHKHTHLLGYIWRIEFLEMSIHLGGSKIEEPCFWFDSPNVTLDTRCHPEAVFIWFTYYDFGG